MSNSEHNEKRVLVFIAAFIVIFCCSASAAFSVFSKPLQEATGANESQVLFTLTIYQTFMALVGIFAGKIVDIKGPKRLMYAGGIIFGLGWILTGYANSLPMLYLTCGVLAGAGNGLLYNPCLNIALKWYPEKKGTMSGIILGAASIGPLVLARVGAILCEQYGTKGLVYVGIAYWAIIWLVGWLTKAPEAGWKPEGWNPITIGNKANSVKDYTPGEMVHTSKFWIMLAMFSVSCTAGIMMIGSLSSIAQVQLGMSAVAASSFVAINSLSNLCGRLLVGRLCDKLGELKALFGILVLTIIALFGLRMATNTVVFTAFLIILGGSFGGVLVVFPPLTSKSFGTKNSGVNYGIMFFGYAVGALLGPQIAARTKNSDLGTQLYSQAFLVAIMVAVVGLLLNLYLMKKAKTEAINSN